jgi:catechol 2,3-dioxygenase-like lactoylglutathione lyase family enzyme
MPNPDPQPRITGLDHLVLTVREIPATIAFYSEVLGLEPLQFDGGRVGLQAGDQKINLHPAGGEYVPHAARPSPGSADFCLRCATDVDEVAASIRRRGVAIEHGPADKVGARAPLRSIYVRDPDGNLVEIANERPAPGR